MKPVSSLPRRLVTVVASASLVMACLGGSAAPVAAASPTVTGVAAGGFHTCAVMSNGTVRCWGNNEYGQLGNGMNDARAHSTPVPVPGISTATAIAAGLAHTCALLAGGTVRCWGFNGYGQLGDGTRLSRDMPVAVSGISTAMAISARGSQTCALLADHTVECWGDNEYGQVGDGTSDYSPRHTPVVVAGISTAIAVTSGGSHTCALLAAGTIRCWGSNFDGTLGNGTSDSNPHATPVAVSGISTATAVSDTCALLADHTIRCWGSNGYGQVGDGTNTTRLTPAEVSGLSTATSIDGHYNRCAVLADATGRCWGDNAGGQLGDGTTAHSTVPVAVSGISEATTIVAGGSHTCALLAAGTVSCWGYNWYGQLGDGTTTTRHTPVAVLLPPADSIPPTATLSAPSSPTYVAVLSYAVTFNEPVSALTASDFRRSGTATGCTIGTPSGSGADYIITVSGCSDGTVTLELEAGSIADAGGNAGPASAATAVTVVIDRTAPVTVSASAAGGGHTCALLAGGTVRCWGGNDSGQLGDGTTTNRLTPVAVSGISTATAISAGSSHTCALLADHTVRCWGSNDGGQLGNGTTANSATPVQVTGISTATAIAAGAGVMGHTCALLADGTIRCWGWNGAGQLGDGTTIQRLTPVAVTGVSTATAITAGGNHSCALVADRTVRCWGFNGYGQLGDGTTTDSPTAVLVSGISTATAIDAGDVHTCAVLAAGTVGCWGDNSSGQLGDGTTTGRLTPVPVTGISAATAITAGGSHTCALLADHTARCWGYNNSGELGDGTTMSRDAPVAVAGLSTAGAIDAGGSHTCGVLTDATARCWGGNASGQLGGSTTTTGLPLVAVVWPPLGPPTGVTAVAGDTSALVSWTAPEYDGGSAITGYTITSSPGVKTCTTSGLSCTVSDLTNGTAYTFTVRATNAAGPGPASAPSAAVTPSVLPGAPTGVTATPGNAQALVWWTAPVFDGGSPILGYEVTSSPGGVTCGTSWGVSCTVYGLTNGTAYAFTVRAHNAAGTGPASGASEPVTPATYPGAPTGVAATPGDQGAAHVSWVPPANNGGSAIVGYRATSSPGNFTCLTTGELACTITGLSLGTTYSFRVGAGNAAGWGYESDASAPMTAIAVPLAPSHPVATPGNASADVSWTAPTSDPGRPVDGYTVTSTPGGRTCTTSGSLSCTVSGLSNGTPYTFVVAAANDAGPGPASYASDPVTPFTVPGAPTTVTAVPGYASAAVSWSAPVSNGGRPVTGYTATSSPGGLTCTTTGLSCVISGLANAVAYTFRVIATNAAGDGPASDASSPVMPYTIPGAPRDVIATPGNASVTVSWNAPASDGGSPITSYTATIQPDGRTCAASGLSCTISGLLNGQGYAVYVAATNASGTGPTQDLAAWATPRTVPAAPIEVLATPGAGSAFVRWASASDGGSPITGFTVTSSPGGKTCTDTGLWCTVTGLTNGTPYTFTVTATNAAGTGPASTPSAPVTPMSAVVVPPTASITALPTWLSTTAIPVSWSATQGSFPVANYDVRYRRAAWNGGFGGYVPWLTRTTATGASFAASPGSTYCFSVFPHDTLDTPSTWTAETCTAVPLDDRSLTRVGSWTKGTGTAYYRSTYLRSYSYGAKLTRTGGVARRIAIVATTCRTCGKVRVYWGSTLLRTISLYSATTVNRKLITVTTFTSTRTGTLSIKVYSSGKKVIIDGVAIRRN